MICPKCGNEIKEGQLLCEKCGFEINIVPDFEIEVENSISETLSTIVDELESDDSDTQEEKEEKKETKKSSSKNPEEEFFESDFHDLAKSMSKKGIIITASVVLASLAVLFVVLFSLYKNTSVNYQISRAYKEADKGRFDVALDYIEKSLSIEKENYGLYCDKAYILFKANRTEEAIDLCKYYIENKKLDDVNSIRFYSILIDIYSSLGEFERINYELINSPYQNVKEEFNDYVALAPEFSIPTGNYEALTKLTITSNSKGSIYYTKDGITPSKDHGTLYTGPIEFEKGEYDIKAVFINEYGVYSEISTGYYLIDVTVPEPPVVIPESGKYTSDFSIIATAMNQNDKIYYTLDGTDPDEENGFLYEGPLKPSLGTSNLAFVAISEDGIKSEIVKRSYELDITGNISAEEAVIYLMNALYLNGHLADLNGSANDGVGVYSYCFTSVIEISGYGYYYSLSEFYTDNQNNTVETVNKYAVNPFTGEAFYLITDGMDNLSIIPLI